MSQNRSNFLLPMAQVLPEVAAPGQRAEEPLASVGPSARVSLEQRAGICRGQCGKGPQPVPLHHWASKAKTRLGEKTAVN